MRAAIWLLSLFAVAVALALFASGNDSTVTVFWPPHRVDLSLNLVLLLLGLLFVLLHMSLKTLGALLAIPAQAHEWRARHQERVIHAALVDALTHLVAGRFIRARKAAEQLLARDAAIDPSTESALDAARLRVLAHLLAAESAQALQDRSAREAHLQQALTHAPRSDPSGAREGVLLRAVRWSLEDRDAAAAHHWLGQLPSGAARRTVALRLRLRVARLAGQPTQAIETARLLIKHRAFAGSSAQSLVRALGLELLRAARDAEQLCRAWSALEPGERTQPDLAVAAAQGLIRMGGDCSLALHWLLPVWEQMSSASNSLSATQETSVLLALDDGFAACGAALDSAWLARIEQALAQRPGDTPLLFLAALACLHLALWGRARHLMTQAVSRLHDDRLLARAWQVLAELAQQQGDEVQAAQAWRRAAGVSWQQRQT